MPKGCKLRGSRWYAYYTDQQKKIWIALPESVKTQRDAEAKRREIVDQVQHRRATLSLPNAANDCAKQLLELSQEFLDAKKPTLHPRSYTSLERYLDDFMKFLGDIDVPQITHDRCRAYAEYRVNLGDSPGYLRRRLIMLRQMLHRAECPALDKIKLPAPARIKSVFITKEQFRELIDVAPDYRAFRYIVLAFTGARQGEAQALRWGHVDMKNKILFVPNAMKGNKNELRQVPITQPLRDALTQARYEAQEAGGGKDTDPILAGVTERVLSDDWVNVRHRATAARHRQAPAAVWRVGLRHNNWRRDLHVDCAAAGIPLFTTHELRHTFCSWLAQDGVSLQTIRDVAGHSSVTMTERYAHLQPRAFGEIHEALNTSLTKSQRRPVKVA